MSESKSLHTPGPWEAYSHIDGYWAVGQPIEASAELTDVARRVKGNNRRQMEANARLIAAAPELLAALKQLKAVVEGPHRNLWKSDWVVADAAIAAAEGKVIS